MSSFCVLPWTSHLPQPRQCSVHMTDCKSTVTFHVCTLLAEHFFFIPVPSTPGLRSGTQYLGNKCMPSTAKDGGSESSLLLEMMISRRFHANLKSALSILARKTMFLNRIKILRLLFKKERRKEGEERNILVCPDQQATECYTHDPASGLKFEIVNYTRVLSVSFVSADLVT